MFEKIKNFIKTGNSEVEAAPRLITGTRSMFEINLVPSVKNEVLKAFRMRNLILFACIVIAAIGGGVVLILGGIVGGQNIALSSQDARLELMSNKLQEFDGLEEYLAIKDQLGNISTVNENKKMLSRLFPLLSVVLNSNSDSVTLSELSIDLKTNTLNFRGQADAKVAPLIDYRVLEAFKKGMSLTKYDYGRYVDEDGNEIPTRCIVEADDAGNTLMEGENIYAYWTKGKKGCDPKRTEEKQTNNEDEKVTIYRTPKFSDWYSTGKMTLSGEISGVPHFDSKCITYSGAQVDNKTVWTANNNCMITANGMEVGESANGRDADDNLVLMFEAAVVLDENIFKFENKHVMTIGPNGQNVTDSYVQVEGIFAEPAESCRASDVYCITNTANSTKEGGNN